MALTFIGMLFFEFLSAQTDCPPHIERSPSPNLVLNSNFADQSNWDLTDDCMDVSWNGYQAGSQTNCDLPNLPIYNNSINCNIDGTGCLVFDKRTPNCFDKATTNIDLTNITTSESETFTISFMAKTIDTWPSPIFTMRLLDQENKALMARRFVVSKNEEWQECVSFIKLDNSTTSVTLELYMDHNISGQCRTVYIDEVYFATGKGYENPPECKRSFVSPEVKVDELGNILVKESGQFQQVFPFGMMGGNFRSDWSTYSNNGFNTMCRLSAFSQVEKAVNAGLPWYTFGLNLWNDDANITDNWMLSGSDGVLGTADDVDYWDRLLGTDRGLGKIYNENLLNNMLYYYIDNENDSFSWWHSIARVVEKVKDFEIGLPNNNAQLHPIYLLNGTYGIARQYQTEYDGYGQICNNYSIPICGIIDPNELANLGDSINVCDMTGTYIGRPSTNNFPTFNYDLLSNLDGQNIPVSIAQINSITDNSMGARLFAAIAHGAKGMNYWRDTAPGSSSYIPNCYDANGNQISGCPDINNVDHEHLFDDAGNIIDDFTDGNGNLLLTNDVTQTDWWGGFNDVVDDVIGLLPLIRKPHWTNWTASHNAGFDIDFGTRNLGNNGYVIASRFNTTNSTAENLVTFTVENYGSVPNRIYCVKHSINGAEGDYIEGSDIIATTNGFQFDIYLDDFNYGVYRFGDLDCDLGDVEVTFSPTRTDKDGYANLIVNVNPGGEYTYTWDDNTTGNTKPNVCIGDDHEVTITDILGCSQTFTFEGQVRPSRPGTIGLPYPCGPSFPSPNDPFPCLFCPTLNNNPLTPIIIGGGKLGANLDQIEVYPNPANSILNVTLNNQEFDEAAIKLYSIAGSELLMQKIRVETRKTILDVSTISNGIYLVKIIADGQEIHTQKLTIAH